MVVWGAAEAIGSVRVAVVGVGVGWAELRIAVVGMGVSVVVFGHWVWRGTFGVYERTGNGKVRCWLCVLCSLGQWASGQAGSVVVGSFGHCYFFAL